MAGADVIFRTMRGIAWIVALGFGSVGIASVWISFYVPDAGLDAITELVNASALILGMPGDGRA